MKETGRLSWRPLLFRFVDCGRAVFDIGGKAKNVQIAVDTEHHLIVTHEVTNEGSDRA
jgi:hypothetical protein